MTTQPKSQQGSKTKKLGNQSDLAKLMDCTQPAVSQMVGKGIVKVRKDGKIDLQQAVKDWKAHVTAPSTFGKKKETTSGDTTKDSARFYKARADREEAQAAMAQMEQHKIEGSLFESVDVKEFVFGAARGVRDALLRMPKRVAPMLVGLDERAICRKLQDEVNDALTGISREALSGKYQRIHKEDSNHEQRTDHQTH